jgi:hypothetical protein
MAEPVPFPHDRKPKPPMAAVKHTAQIIVLPMIRTGWVRDTAMELPCDCGCSER